MATIQWNANLLDFTFVGDFESGLNWKGGVAPGANDIAVLGPEAGSPYLVTSNPGLLALLSLSAPAVEVVKGLQTASNVTLGLTGDVSILGLLQQDTVLDLTDGTAGGKNAGTIDIRNAVLDTGIPIVGGLVDSLLGASATLEVSGVFDNTGTVLVDQQAHLLSLLGAPAQSAFFDVSGHVRLTGGGHVTLTDEAYNFVEGVTAASLLENVDNTISGAGQLGGGQMTFRNDVGGVVDADDSLSLNLDTAGKEAINLGLLEATSGGSLIVLDTHLRNTGTILATTTSAVVLDHAYVIAGVLNTEGSGVIETAGAQSIVNGLTNKGMIDIQPGTSLTIAKVIDNIGHIDVAGSSTIASRLVVGLGGATLTGLGNLTLTHARVVGTSPSAELVNFNNTISGFGDLGGGKLTLVNDAAGIIDATVGDLLIAVSGVLDNAGILETTSSELVVESGVDNTGHIIANKGKVVIEGAVTGSGSANILNGGILTFDSSFTQDVAFNGSGSKGKLVLEDSAGYTGTITDLSTTGSNSLDLADIGFASGVTTASYSGTTSGGVLTVTNGANTAKIHLSGDYLGSTFHLSSDGTGGTKVVDPAATSTTAHFVSAMAGFGAPAASGAEVASSTVHGQEAIALASPAHVIA